MKPVPSSLLVYLVCQNLNLNLSLELNLNMSAIIAFPVDLLHKAYGYRSYSTAYGCRVIERSYRLDSYVAVQRDDKGNFRTLARRADDGQTLSVHLGQPAMCIG